MPPLRGHYAHHLVHHRWSRYRQDAPSHWVQAHRYAASALSSSAAALPVASRLNREQCARDVIVDSMQAFACVPFEGLSAHQVAYTDSVMWDSKDLPRGFRANFARRGLGSFKTSDIGELVAYSLFPVEMKARLVDSLHLLQKISLDPLEGSRHPRGRETGDIGMLDRSMGWPLG